MVRTSRLLYAGAAVASCLVLLSASAVASTGITIVGPEDEDIWSIAERFGVPLALLGAVFWTMVRAGRYLGPHLVAWIASQVEQSRVVCDAVPKMERALDRAAEGVESIPNKLDEIQTAVSETDRKVAELLGRRGV